MAPRPDAVLEPAGYLDVLTAAGLAADVWETTYLHVLTGDDPVLGWVRGTVLRPVLAQFGDDDAARFTAEYAAALRGRLSGAAGRHDRAALPADLRRRHPGQPVTGPCGPHRSQARSGAVSRR